LAHRHGLTGEGTDTPSVPKQKSAGERSALTLGQLLSLAQELDRTIPTAVIRSDVPRV
jgi:hypothetical protein